MTFGSFLVLGLGSVGPLAGRPQAWVLPQHWSPHVRQALPAPASPQSGRHSLTADRGGTRGGGTHRRPRPGRTRGAGPTSPTGPAPDGGAASLPRKGGAARDKLNQVAEAVYQRMDQLYQGKMYFPGYFPNELRSIFRDQVHLIQNAIIESRIDCQRHCGIFQYETISCNNCTDSHVICFGYNCE